MLVTVEFYSGSSPRAAAARHHVLQESLRDPSFLVWIDEADQIVNDAGDFRPSLQYLEGLTDRLPRSSFLLSSATWTTRMLRTGLSFYYPTLATGTELPQGTRVVSSEVDRVNLRWSVLQADGRKNMQATVARGIEAMFIKSHRQPLLWGGAQCLIFVRSRCDADRLFIFIA